MSNGPVCFNRHDRRYGNVEYLIREVGECATSVRR